MQMADRQSGQRWGTMSEGVQNVETCSYKISKCWVSNVQHVDDS